MIDSIIPLPEYCSRGKSGFGRPCLDGTRYCGLYSGMCMFDDITDLRVDGRQLYIPENMFKYKLQLTDYQVNRIYTIIGLTDREIDLFSPRHDRNNEAVFYPLYVREYSRSGAMRAKNGNTFLWIPGINRLFEDIGVPSVCSLVDAFEHCMSIGAVQDFSGIPDCIKDHALDARFATLAPYPDDVMISVVDGEYDDIHVLNQVVDECCVLEGYFSDRLMYCLNCQRFGQLIPLIDPHHRNSMISECVAYANSTWSVMYSWVHKTDDSCPRYAYRDVSECIASMLHMTSLMNTLDFDIRCLPPSQLQETQSGGFNPLTFNPAEVGKFPIINKMSDLVHTLFSQGYFANTTDYHGVGSYLEEILIYDSDNELVCYIDMVWWILATAYGLLNHKCVYI